MPKLLKLPKLIKLPKLRKLHKLDNLFLAGHAVEINWHYDEDDEDLEETANECQKILSVKYLIKNPVQILIIPTQWRARDILDEAKTFIQNLEILKGIINCPEY